MNLYEMLSVVIPFVAICAASAFIIWIYRDL